ncbi:MAG: hypothetical protein HRT35_04025 [Algicola sp.]|nr:hypothetical protein [Algicola sp.]
MNKDSSDISFDLNYLLNLAISEGELLESFSDFGMEQKGEDGHYNINYKKWSFMIPSASFFRKLQAPHYKEFWTSTLLSEGFLPEGIKIIEDHVKTNKIEALIQKENRAFERKIIPWLTRMIEHKTSIEPEAYQHHLALLRYNNKLIEHNTYRNWSLALMAKLNKKQQQILKSQLIKKFNTTGLFWHTGRSRAEIVSNYESGITHYNKRQVGLVTKPTTRIIKIANIDKLQIQTVIGKDGLNDLYDQFATHYGEFVTGINTTKVNFDFIMDVQSGETAMLLQYLYIQAQRENLVLDSFIDFGIPPHKSGGFRLAHQKSPHLVSLKYFIDPLTSAKFFERNAKLLIKRGFKEEDINVINQYQQQHPSSKINQQIRQSSMNFINDNSAFLTKTIASKSTIPPAQYQSTFDKIFYVADYYKFHHNRNWAMALMAKLEPKQQKILKTVLIEVISGSENDNPAPIHSRGELVEERMDADKFVVLIQSLLNQPQTSQKLN